MPKFFDALILRKLKQRKNNSPMKQLQTFLLVTAAWSLAAASAYAQAAKSSPAAGVSPSTPTTVASAIDREISLVEKEVVEAAEAMPEEKFDVLRRKLNIPGSDYKVWRTFAEQQKHVAASNYLFWSRITARNHPTRSTTAKAPTI